MMSENANALKLAVVTVVIYVAAITWGLRLLYYLSYVLAGVLIAAFIWSQLNRRGLVIRRKLTPLNAQVGQVIEEIISVENSFGLPKLWVEVRDRSTLPGHHVGAVVSLPGHRSKRWRVRTRCTHRGLYHVGPTAITTGDPFGLFKVSRVFRESTELLVYPPTVPLSSFGIPEGDLPGGTHTERRATHTTTNAAGIREYMPGDPMNRIHWPLTARTQKLMVKEFELDPTADLWIVLDLHEDVHAACPFTPDYTQGAAVEVYRAPVLRPFFGNHSQVRDQEPETFKLRLDPSTEEYAITVAASVAALLLAEGRSVGFAAWGQHRVELTADRGGRQLIKILRALSVLRAEGTAPLGELLAAESRHFSRQDTLIVITPSLHDEWIASLQDLLHRSIRATAVLVEPATFCGSGNALPTVGALTAVNVPTYLVKRDDSIDAALGQQYSGQAARNFR